VLRDLLIAVGLPLALLVGFSLGYIAKEEKTKTIMVYKEVSLENLNYTPSNFSKFLESEENKVPNYLLQEVKDVCYKNNVLNFACAVYYLNEKENFHYILETDDKLETVREFLRNKGGDCEDYSLFYFKFLDEFYRTFGFNGITALKKGDSKVELYKEGNVIYYVPNATKFEIERVKKLGILCFLLNSTLGHCLLYVNDYLLEPQNGMIVGRVLNKNEVIYNNTKREIHIITDKNKIYLKKWGFWLVSN